MQRLYFIVAIVIFTSIACKNVSSSESAVSDKDSLIVFAIDSIDLKVITGAERTKIFLPYLENKYVAIVSNQTSMINNYHTVDSLISMGVNLIKIFCPEHGFRGDADAGEIVKDYVDEKTGLKVVSLYGNNKKPTNEQLSDIDVIIFDLQDVGARFYTYISTLHYIMESCAENDIELIIFDRPNPNGFYVDGPVLDMKFTSFVGMHPVPVVHGMTIGEYAQMINGEKWLNDSIQCKLKVIACENYDHKMKYELPVRPSPNLPNSRSVELYPSLCLFEGTDISVGRGTEMQFQVIGHPKLKDVADMNFSFIPSPNAGAKNPVHNGKNCYGYDLRSKEEEFSDTATLNLNYLLYVYEKFPDKKNFFLKNNMFNLLAGNDILKQQIISGKTDDEIHLSWKANLEKFKKIRKKYLIYKDFE
ncbi:MAG: DUF1343 domain-containing protein [Bacteroidota bacterium]